MQKYFVSPACIHASRIVLTGDDVHHMAKVMRFRPGDEVICSDGRGRDFHAVIRSFEGAAATLDIVQELSSGREPSVDIWLAQSLPKADKMDWVLQKGTEIGAARFIPFTSARTIVQLDGGKEAKRRERWHKIVKEAAEQAHRSVLPVVSGVLAWKALLALAAEADLALVAYEGEEGRHIGDALSAWKKARSAVPAPDTVAPLSAAGVPAAGESFAADQHRDGAPAKAAADPVAPSRPRIVVAIGPEGGFAETEIAEARQAGWLPVGLGRRVLRTETAGLVACAAILYSMGEMGGG